MPIPLVNPYFEVGQLHNQGLDYVASQLHAPEVPEISRLLELVLDWYITQNTTAPPEVKAAVYSLAAAGTNSTVLSTPAELYEKAGLSSEAANFLNESLALTGDFSFIISQLDNITKQALTAGLSDNDQFYVLTALAVGSASAKYGLLQQELGDQSPWAGYGNKPWPWNIDEQAAVGGAISGSVGGIFGPPGVLLGGILGAVVGGLGGSLGAWLFP